MKSLTDQFFDIVRDLAGDADIVIDDIAVHWGMAAIRMMVGDTEVRASISPGTALSQDFIADLLSRTGVAIGFRADIGAPNAEPIKRILRCEQGSFTVDFTVCRT